MDLLSSNTIFKSDSSLNSGAGNVLELPVAAQAERIRSQPIDKASLDAKLNTSTAVVTQLVTGSEAAAAVYDQVASSERVSIKAASNEVSSDSNKSLEQALKTTQAELAVTEKLAARDREVKAHEQTHSSIGGAHAGAPSFTYTSGPDGRLYATAGEVAIDTSPVENDPRSTLEKAEVIIRAALSVKDPSSADRQVAAEAKSLALQAMAELRTDSDESEDESSAAPVAAEEKGKQEEVQQLKDEERKQKNELLAAEREKRNADSIEVLKEYNVKISEIQETLRRLNLQLVDSGAFNKLFPEGFLIDKVV